MEEIILHLLFVISRDEPHSLSIVRVMLLDWKVAFPPHQNCEMQFWAW